VRIHPPLPDTITIASGHNQGLYNKFAKLLQAPLEANTQSKVIVKETIGAQENHVLLKAGEADLAIIQAGAVDMDQIAALIPHLS